LFHSHIFYFVFGIYVSRNYKDVKDLILKIKSNLESEYWIDYLWIYVFKTKKYIEQLNEGLINSFSMEKKYIRKNGAEVWGGLTLSVIKDENENFLYYNAIIENINERKLIEHEIITNRNRFQTLFEYSPVAIWEEDMSESKKVMEMFPAKMLEKMIMGSIKVMNKTPRVKILNMNRSALELFKIDSVDDFNKILGKKKGVPSNLVEAESSLFGDEVERIVSVDPLTGEIIQELDGLALFPASHYVTD